MMFRFSHPEWLWLFPPVLIWMVWLARTSTAILSLWRRRISITLRVLLLLLVFAALAGLQLRKREDGMNVFFLLDRSRSVPEDFQVQARDWINRTAAAKPQGDRAGLIVFGADAGIESEPREMLSSQRFDAVIVPDRTDIAGAIRLATAAFPDEGQNRIVVVSDGQANLGDAQAAVLAARSTDVTVDVLPVRASVVGDVIVRKALLPSNVKRDQTFDLRVFVDADRAARGTLRVFLNDRLLGEQAVDVEAGGNLFALPQTLKEPGFYRYETQLEVDGDPVPRNNRAFAFASVRGQARVLVLTTEDPALEQPLAEALRLSGLLVEVRDVNQAPQELAEWQVYDGILLANVPAGSLGRTTLQLMDSAVRDFGVGLVCLGGDNAYGAGAYRSTALEELLPVTMDLDSRKVMPKGALVLVMHGMEFMNGNQISRDIALATLESLGPRDELGVILWDGVVRWQLPLAPVGNRQEAAKAIAGMNQGDLQDFEDILGQARQALEKSDAHLKHMVVFSDGDPGRPSEKLMQDVVDQKITVSTILIAGHAGPETMIYMAGAGKGRFYNITSPAELPQVFIKEAAVILKSAISEEPFVPVVQPSGELGKGWDAAGFPSLLGHVATMAKPRAEVPLVTPGGDPVLAHWQYGLGRTVAFTSDARTKWGRDWVSWSEYRAFWSQVVRWSLRRVEVSQIQASFEMDRGKGRITVEALDGNGDYRNFLDLRATVVDPEGQREVIRLEQDGPGHYTAGMEAQQVGAYVVNLMEFQEGQLVGAQTLGASVNYSPEFEPADSGEVELEQIAEGGEGKVLQWDGSDAGPFAHDRRPTFHSKDLWSSLLTWLVFLFPLDIAVRRLQWDASAWARWLRRPHNSAAANSDGMTGTLLKERKQAQEGSASRKSRETKFRSQVPSGTVQSSSIRTVSGSSYKPEVPAPIEEAPQETGAGEDSVTRRLLDAKERSKRRRKR